MHTAAGLRCGSFTLCDVQLQGKRLSNHYSSMLAFHWACPAAFGCHRRQASLLRAIALPVVLVTRFTQFSLRRRQLVDPPCLLALNLSILLPVRRQRICILLHEPRSFYRHDLRRQRHTVSGLEGVKFDLAQIETDPAVPAQLIRAFMLTLDRVYDGFMGRHLPH